MTLTLVIGSCFVLFFAKICRRICLITSKVMFTVYPSPYVLVPSHLVPVLPARVLLVPDFHLSSSAAQRPTSSVFAVRGIAPADSGYRR